MSNIEPLLSVIITVYNGMPYLRDTVDALLIQTYNNFEIIIVDDGSTDDTPQYLDSLTDNRIFVIKEKRIGRGKALNLAILNARGKYLAINDADDISFPERIEKQVIFLENNPDYGLVGSHSRIKNYKTGEIKHHSRPLDNESIKRSFTRGQPLQHVTVTMRKSIVEKVGGYNENIAFLFDRDIFLRVAQHAKVYNLPDELVEVGQHDNRFFEGRYKGLKREFKSLKYRIKAIWLFDFPKIWILREIFWSAWAMMPYSLRKPLINVVDIIKTQLKNS